MGSSCCGLSLRCVSSLTCLRALLKMQHAQVLVCTWHTGTRWQQLFRSAPHSTCCQKRSSLAGLLHLALVIVHSCCTVHIKAWHTWHLEAYAIITNCASPRDVDSQWQQKKKWRLVALVKEEPACLGMLTSAAVMTHLVQSLVFRAAWLCLVGLPHHTGQISGGRVVWPSYEVPIAGQQRRIVPAASLCR